MRKQSPARIECSKSCHRIWFVVVILFSTTGLNGPIPAQDDGLAEIPLHQREPFDRITLDIENKSAVVELFPIDTIDRSKPVSESGKRSFVVRRIQDPPDRLYSVGANHIAKFELFHDLLLAAAGRHIQAEEVDEAFLYLARLVNDFPDTVGLKEAVQEFQLADARLLFGNRRFDESLLALDQVYSQNPNRPGLSLVLNGLLEEIIRIEFSAENFESMLRKIRYARNRYGNMTKTTVDFWEEKLKVQANKQFVFAKQAFDNGAARTALVASQRALQIWPDLEGVAKLNRAILAKYPRIRVGVSQAYAAANSAAQRAPKTLNWATRRTEPLVRRRIVEMTEFTSDGGQYSSPIGLLTTTPDRKQITLSLRSEQGSYDLCRSLLRRAEKSDPEYLPRWAEFLESIFVPNPNTLKIRMTRPTLRPATLLPALSTPDELDDVLAGEFALHDSPSGEFQSFQLRNSRQKTNGVREIAERFFEDPSDLTDALINGDIDIIDRVYPPDLAKLRSHPNISVVPYRIPTVHVLVFNDREPLLRSSTFRRGLLYGINREQFLLSEIIAGGSANIAQVLSGPLPAGESIDDPLGYAYSRNIKARDHDPSLALVLLRLAQAQRDLLVGDFQSKPGHSKSGEDSRAQTNSPEPQAKERGPVLLPSLVIAYPGSPIAKSACTAIAYDLRRVGLDVSTRAIEAGMARPVDNDWDILYIEATMEDPFVDFPDLVLGHSLLGRHGGLVWQATRSLQEAASLEEARDWFAKIHKLSFDHTPLLPLWQLIEHVAFRRDIREIGDSPVSLYKNISNWRFTP